MRSNFSFKHLLNRMPNVSIPKEFIYFGIGTVLIIILGLIVGNMYLQEMLFIEGIEKSIPLYTEEELREYGNLYKELEKEFEEEIASKIQTYANRTNRRGDRIKYGVYGQYNTEDLLNDDFVDGVTIKYAKTSGREDGESNLQDILSAVAILIDQKQSKSEENNKRLIRALYKVSHTFTGTSTDLYPCTHGCFCDYYHCSDIADNPIYDHCNIKYQPFSITPHDEYDDYSEEEFEIVEPLGECEVCAADSSKMCYDQRGCVQDGTCYHGEEDEENGTYYLGRGRTEDFVDKCTKCHDENDCQHECEGCGGEELGCIHECNSDCYDCFCDGHEHWCCPDGHYYICCMGHTNITINIRIMYLSEMMEELKK